MPSEFSSPPSASEYVQALRRSDRLGAQVAAYHFVDRTAAKLERIPVDMPDAAVRILSFLGITHLFSHQVEALSAVRKSHHTIVATPTASGKSLIYLLPMFEAVSQNAQAGGLYIFPLKALTQDQFKTFNRWAQAVPHLDPRAAIYDGDTSAYQRRKIRDRPPNVLMTNPEMVHLALLPHHAKWSGFFRNLKLVVIDEVHTYRGLLGSHFSQVLRRLHRICSLYGASPTFIFTSATVANPGDLAGRLSGLEIDGISRSGAPAGPRHMVIMDPDKGPAQTAIALLKAGMARGLRTIVYTQSRKLAELITLWVQQQSGRFADKISVYRAGLMPAERRKIENDLKQGRILAVVSTSALELGIDIGDLDVCILAGYPGSMIATTQRGGRVGRKGQDSALIMIAAQDALDQYFVSNPRAFFNGRVESTVINPHNPVVLDAHLECAAVELPLDLREPWLQPGEIRNALVRLEKAGLLLRTERGDALVARRRRPHLKVDLRSAGRKYDILDGRRHIGDIGAFRVYRETHPGAIYLHQGQTYQVVRIDEPGRSVQVRPAAVDYYTRTSTDSDIQIIEVYESKNYGKTKVYSGKLKVEDHVLGFEKVLKANGLSRGYTDLQVPPVVFETDGIWLAIPSEAGDLLISRSFDLLGSLHAAEHAAIGILPLLVLADRNDVGGLATPFHPQVRSACIFIYDGVPGGAGFSLQAYRQADELVRNTMEAIERCPCDSGCPACVHSPKCGSGNQPMDKSGALFLLREISLPASRRVIQVPAKPSVSSGRPENAVERRPLHYGVFDLETQRSAQEVGGWHRAHRMKVSCGVIFDCAEDSYTVYLEQQVEQLIAHLKRFDLVVGFNSTKFDYKVLAGYSNYDFKALPSLDLLELVHNHLGFRLSLDHLAQNTLHINKSGSGLDALRWWQEGQLQKIIDYCRMDVRITKDLYLYARRNGYLIYQRRDGQRLRIPVQVP